MESAAEILRLKHLSTSSSGPPDDIVSEARRRLRAAAFVYSGAFLLAYGIPRVIFADQQWSGQAMSDAIAGFAIALGLVLGLVLGPARRLSGHAFFKIALSFEVVSAFCIAMSEFWFFFHPAHLGIHEGGADVHGISWVCVWILAFPALVPASFKQATVATILSASSTPLVLLASFLHHEPALQEGLMGQLLTGTIVANGVSAVLAIVVSRLIHGLTRKVSEARKLGSYQLTELIGKGGMGEVWRGDHRLLARPAAVKLVRPEALDQGSDHARALRVLKRFEREAQATAQLRCPHSIGLYDFGIAEDGTFYYVMELLEGLSLETLVERFGPQPAERVVHLILQVCESLDEAHQRGLVHRDVKPANIFCCRYGLEPDFVKVLDFGLVKSHEHLRSSATKLTIEGAAAGTPAYMAPEAITGEVELEPRSDIYALGCVAFWLLTGNMVFEASTPMKMAVMHIDETPAPPSSVSELEIPKALDRIILDCLQKAPNDRPASMAVVAERLAAIELTTPWTRERAESWWQKHQPVESQTGSFVSRGTTPVSF